MRRDWALSAAQRADAREALVLLEGTELTLAEVARRAVAGQRATRRVPVHEAIDEFLREVIRRQARPATVLWYEDKLRVFVAAFGEKLLDTVSRTDLVTWLEGLPCRDAGRRHYARATRALWRWAQRHNPPLVGSDITLGLVPRRVATESAIHFLPVEECQKVLLGAGRYRSAVALALFAGLRPEEIAGKGKPWLRWEHVRKSEKILRVPADISKTRRARILEKLPAALWAWIQPGQGEISPGRSRQVTELCAQLAGYGAGRKWPHDVLRHTFASYAVASTADPGLVALWLGHEGNPTMLFRHYRGLATKADAKRFWALRPA
jgi:site-specific recombinase XerD